VQQQSLARFAVWHGTEAQATALLRAIEHNCECTRTAAGARLQACAAHAMLIADQRALDGLLFVRSLAARLQAEEGTVEGSVEGSIQVQVAVGGSA
jgi:hypothetical protein